LKIPLIPIASPLHDPRAIEELLGSVRFQLASYFRFLDFRPLLVEPGELPDSEGVVILFLLTGGTETLGAKIKAKEHLLLVHPGMNSLPAALELRTYLETTRSRVQILTLEELKKLLPVKAKAREALGKFTSARLTLIGEPASWLVGSDISLSVLGEKWGIAVEKLSLKDLIKEWREAQLVQEIGMWLARPWKGVEMHDLSLVLRLSSLIEKKVKEGKFSGVALSCFEFLNQTGQSGCLALANLNNSGIPAACEGDLPSLLTMLLLSLISEKPTFMANPAWIEKDEVLLAHCTVAPGLVSEYSLRSHFESGKSVAIEGSFPHGTYTLAKIAPSLEEIFFSPCQSVAWQKKEDLCRTQVCLRLPGAEKLKKLSLANHLILVPDDWSGELNEISCLLGLRTPEHF